MPRRSRRAIDSSGAGSCEPAAHIDLRVRLSAVMPGVGRVGGLFRPLVNREFTAVAMDHNPAIWHAAFFAADFTSIDSSDQSATSV